MKPVALVLSLLLCLGVTHGDASEQASFQWPSESTYKADWKTKQEISDIFYYSATLERLGTEEDEGKMRLAALSRFPASNNNPILGWRGQKIKQVRWMDAQLALIAVNATAFVPHGVSVWDCVLVLVKDASGNWAVHRNYQLYIGGAIE